MRYKHIFFDLDHTLWDFETNARDTLAELYGEFELGSRGIPEFRDFHSRYSHHNDIMWDRFRKGYITRDLLRWKRMHLTLVDFKIADEPLAHRMSSRFLEVLPTKTHLFPYAIELLDYLKSKDYPMHLITNGFIETQKRKLDHSGISGYFTYIITSEEAGSLKPDKKIFEFALDRVKALPAETLMVGDHFEVDIVGAMAAGMDQAYFNPAIPAGPKAPTYSIGSLQELITLL